MTFATRTLRGGIPVSALWTTPTSKRVDYVQLEDSPIGYFGTPSVIFKQSRGSIQVAATSIQIGYGDGSVQNFAENFLTNPDTSPVVGLWLRFLSVPTRSFPIGVLENVWYDWFNGDVTISCPATGVDILRACTVQISADPVNILRSLSVDLVSSRTDD